MKKSRKKEKMATTLKKFTTQMTQMSEELYDIFPNDKDLMMWKEALSMLIKANPVKLMESFIYFVLPMREKIMSRSEEFFMADDFKNTMNQKSGEDMSFMHTKICSLWKSQLNEDDKDIVWQYFQVLVVLAERYIQENI